MALVMSVEFYTLRSIAPDKLNTKKLGISTALQLRHTPENFGEVMVDKVSGEVAGWNNGVNVIKEGVTYKTSKALTYLCFRYLKILKKRKEIKENAPYLEQGAQQYFKEMLADSGQNCAKETSG